MVISPRDHFRAYQTLVVRYRSCSQQGQPDFYLTNRSQVCPRPSNRSAHVLTKPKTVAATIATFRCGLTIPMRFIGQAKYQAASCSKFAAPPNTFTRNRMADLIQVQMSSQLVGVVITLDIAASDHPSRRSTEKLFRRDSRRIDGMFGKLES